MDEEALKDFGAVYEEKSMSKAAERRFTLPSSLMRHINALEDELGCRLFMRSSTGCAPTDDGHYLYQQIMPLLRQMRDIHQHFSGREAIRVCMPEKTFLPLIESYCSGYMAIHKNAQFDYIPSSTSDWIKMVAENSADCALLVHNSIPMLVKAGLQYAPIGLRRIICILDKAHPLARHTAVTLDMLRPYAVYSDVCYGFENPLKDNSHSFTPIREDPSLADYINICRGQGVYITTTPFHTQLPMLAQIPLEGLDPVEVGFAYARRSPDLLDFFEYCKSVNAAI